MSVLVLLLLYMSYFLYLYITIFRYPCRPPGYISCCETGILHYHTGEILCPFTTIPLTKDLLLDFRMEDY